MCNCIKELEKNMIGREVGNGTKKRLVVSASFTSGALIFGNSTVIQSTSIVECTLEGQKKPYEQNIIHTYCPFCGVKYSEL